MVLPRFPEAERTEILPSKKEVFPIRDLVSHGSHRVGTEPCARRNDAAGDVFCQGLFDPNAIIGLSGVVTTLRVAKERRADVRWAMFGQRREILRRASCRCRNDQGSARDVISVADSIPIGMQRRDLQYLLQLPFGEPSGTRAYCRPAELQ
jgi:hypothetical protein